MSGIRTSLYCLFILSACFSSAISQAQEWRFVPTEAEYASWPEHCRVQYSWVTQGLSKYGNPYSESVIDAWRNRIGAKTFIGIHHYCVALIYLDRLPLERSEHERSILVDLAINDAAYMYVRAERESILFPNIATTMAKARYENEDIDEAIKILTDAINADPTRIEPYAALTVIYREQGDTENALKVLSAADTAMGGSSAEIKYNLGLLQIETNQIDEAVKSASAAYSLGHPLPGLRNRLQRLGRTIPIADANTQPDADE